MNSTKASDKLTEEMLSHLEPPIPLIDRDAKSKVAAFYAGRIVFITGATGFIGKALIEKLLRSCDSIKRIYFLVREKRGKSIDERLTDLIESQCFDRLREQLGSAASKRDAANKLLRQKLFPIKGDITLPKFGISAEDMALLSRDVSLVINSAATIRFHEPIEVAFKNNIYSVGELVEFCNDLEHLEAIVHLSTAYSNCNMLDSTIEEIFYEPPMTGDYLNTAIKNIQEAEAMWTRKRANFCKNCGSGGEREQNGDYKTMLELVTPSWLRRAERPNTYTFTKAISESYLLDRVRAYPQRYLGDKIQVAVVRPSIVGSAWREPIVGLVDNFNGPTGAILSLYTGALQAMPGNGKNRADLVPVDMVTNAVLCVGYFLVENNQQGEEEKEEAKGKGKGKGNEKKRASSKFDTIKQHNGVYLFNFVSGWRNPLHWYQVTEMIAELSYKFPSSLLTRLPSSFFIRAGKLYDLYDRWNHKLPAQAMDFVQAILSSNQSNKQSDNKPTSDSTPAGSSMRSYLKIKQMTDTLTPFTSNQWKLSDKNTQSLFESLDATDRSVFHFDVKTIDWRQYLGSYILGSRIYTMRDAPEKMSLGMAKLKRRQILYALTMSLLALLTCWFIVQFLC